MKIASAYAPVARPAANYAFALPESSSPRDGFSPGTTGRAFNAVAFGIAGLALGAVAGSQLGSALIGPAYGLDAAANVLIGAVGASGAVGAALGSYVGWKNAEASAPLNFAAWSLAGGALGACCHLGLAGALIGGGIGAAAYALNR